MIRPKRPNTELKISITSILTKLRICQRRFGGVGGEPGYIQGRIGRIRKRGTAAVDTDGNAAYQVAHADRDARPEERVARVVAVGRVCGLALERVQLGREDDGHDDAVDGDDFAEDDGDQVLGSDSRRPDTSAEDGRACDENAPAHVRMLL